MSSNIPPSKRAYCTVCSKAIYRSTTSSPEPVCRPCRRQRVVEVAARKAVERSERAAGRPKRASAAGRGYGYWHQKLREKLLGEFIDGTPCGRCNAPMSASDPMDLDHTDDRSGYIGLSHATCNRTHGTPRRVIPCPICGTVFRCRNNQHTCSRRCGVEWKRLNSAAA